MLEFGTIVETKEENNKALAKVNILGRVTNFLPILSEANSFKRKFSPARTNEQVAVLDDVLILGSIFNTGCSEPSGNDKKEITQFEDGTTIYYDSSKSELYIDVVKEINITCQNANIKADIINMQTNTSTTIKSPIINLLGNTSIQGSISTAGDGGVAGTFKLNGTLDITESIITGGNATIGGSVTDSRGNLTYHTNDGHGRD